MTDKSPDSANPASPARRALDDILASHEDIIRSIARRRLRAERPNHTLAPTDIVHELFLRLAVDKTTDPWTHDKLLGLSARVIRNILVDHARAKKTEKRGGHFERIPLPDLVDDEGESADPVDVLALHEALHEIERTSPETARLIELRFFTGLTIDETADLMERDRGWVNREWKRAKLHLAMRLEGKTSS